jgi:hypothetical protein
MILPFPAAAKMTSKNVIDTSSGKNILKDMAAGFVPRSLGRGLTLSDSRSVEVFDTGDYTVVLAENAQDIPGALHRVPANKRPRINTALFDAYAKWYPEWPIALCCFEARAEVKGDPMLWAYEPKNPGKLFLPGLDGHDGRVPDLAEWVSRDHTLVVGTRLPAAASILRGHRVRYTDDNISSDLKQYLPTVVLGSEVKAMRVNADFYVNVTDVLQNKFEFYERTPPGTQLTVQG